MAGTPLHILSFGAGAIGTYIGGSLALAGHKVVFLEIPGIAEQLRRGGLHLEVEGVSRHLAKPVVADSLPEALTHGTFDFALFAMKSYDTASALEHILPYKDSMPPILTVQNGVENEAAIAGVLGADRVIPGIVTSAIGRRAAGDIVLERKRGIGIAAHHRLATTIVEEFTLAGLNARLYQQPEDMKWSKMLTNLLANATSAILNMTPTEIFNHSGLYHLEMTQLREALEVMHAQGIQVVDLPATPVRGLELAARLPAFLSRRLVRNAVGGGRGGKMPSFYLDLHSGRKKSEVEFLNGAVVRIGERLGVRTSANALLTDTLMALTTGNLPIATYDHQPEKLLGLLRLGQPDHAVE